MKRILLVLALLSLTGCSKLYNEVRHLGSSVMGINRRITLYAGDGKPLGQWTCRCTVEMRGGDVWFIADGGKAIAVMGTVLVEEL